MEQTHIPTGHIEEDATDKLVESLKAAGVIRESISDAELRTYVQTAFDEYKGRVIDESWEGWTLTQGLAYNEQRDRIEDGQRRLEEARKSLHSAARRYNRHVFDHHTKFPDEEQFEAHSACTGEGCEQCPPKEEPQEPTE